LIYDIPNKQGEGLELWEGHVEEGPTIIYVPTRKETLSIAKFLCKFGVRAAAYNAKVTFVVLLIGDISFFILSILVMSSNSLPVKQTIYSY